MVNFARLTGFWLAVVLGAFASVAHAEGAAPRLHHAPVSVSKAHEPLIVTAEIAHPELVKRAILAYRESAAAPYVELEFKRGAPGPYVAEVPAEALNPPELGYLIELEGLDGARRPCSLRVPSRSACSCPKS